jgi:membrane protein DedA with SNARE-associated domain
MLEQFTSLLIHTIAATGYSGVFFLMFLGSALIPIPSEIVLPFTGFLTSKGVFFYPFIVATAALGDLAGSMVLYGIGRTLEEHVLLGLIKKHGKYILLSQHDYITASAWFKRFGPGIVFVAKLIPGLRYLISLPAGALNMKFSKFCLYTFFGSILWCITMIYVGVFLGDRWASLGPYFTKFRDVIIVLVLLLIAMYVIHKLHLLPSRPQKKTGES